MNTKTMVENLTCILGLNRGIVGVKFIFSKEEFDALDVPQVRYKLSYCNMVKLAAMGKSHKANFDNFLCMGSAKALGLAEREESAISGNLYYSFKMYDSLCTARNVQKDVTFLDHKLYGVLVMPLEKYETDPDVAIFIVNPYQGMRIQQGYVFHHGVLKNIKVAGNSGMCSECTATPYDNNDINLSLLCSNTRYAAKWKDSELGIGIPFNMFESIYDGITKTIEPCEPNERKLEIIERAEKSNKSININLDSHYYRKNR